MKLPAFLAPFRNRFLLTGAIALVWLLFVDRYDFFFHISLQQKIRQMEKDKAFYISEIDRIRIDKEKLFSDPEELERFAREQYWMKRNNEDLYIVTDPREEDEKDKD